MRQKSVHSKSPSERIVKNIRRATRKRHSSEEKIRIVLDGLRGESSIAELCRREGIAESLYYAWSKEFLEAGKRRPRHGGPGAQSPFTAASFAHHEPFFAVDAEEPLVGDAAIHRAFKPTERELKVALDVVEGVFSPIFGHMHEAEKLANRVPPRAARPTKK